MQTTFFYLRKFLMKLADDQSSLTTKASLYHIKHYVHTTFYHESGLTWNWTYNGSISILRFSFVRHKRSTKFTQIINALNAQIYSNRSAVGYDCYVLCHYLKNQKSFIMFGYQCMSNLIKITSRYTLVYYNLCCKTEHMPEYSWHITKNMISESTYKLKHLDSILLGLILHSLTYLNMIDV